MCRFEPNERSGGSGGEGVAAILPPQPIKIADYSAVFIDKVRLWVYTIHMSNDEAQRRLDVVNGEIAMYYQPKPEGHELVEGAKVYSAKDFDALISEQFRLKRQLGIS